MASKSNKQSALTQKKTSKSAVICPICDEAVIDPSTKNVGQDSIFCDGACKAWLHRGCAGLSKSVFEEVCKSDDPFLCPHCMLIHQRAEIINLKASLNSISDELSSIKSLVECLSSSQPHSSQPNQSQSPSSLPVTRAPYSSVAGLGDGVDRHLVPLTLAPTTQHDQISRSDQRYNVIVFGVEEQLLTTFLPALLILPLI